MTWIVAQYISYGSCQVHFLTKVHSEAHILIVYLDGCDNLNFEFCINLEYGRK